MSVNSEWILLAFLAAILLKPKEIAILARLLGKALRHAEKARARLIGDDFKHEENDRQKKRHPFRAAPPGAKTQPIKD